MAVKDRALVTKPFGENARSVPVSILLPNLRTSSKQEIALAIHQLARELEYRGELDL